MFDQVDGQAGVLAVGQDVAWSSASFRATVGAAEGRLIERLSENGR
ncbi:hypothetical protein [Streptomyces sp. NPDC001135]